MTRRIAKTARKDTKQPLPANATGGRPVVAIVGRPNVGKSTLFNRLVGKRLAIVEDVPGVTRDRHYADADFLGRTCVVIDTGGFDPDSDDPMKEGITGHVLLALEEADVVICLFDATTGVIQADREAVRLLRETDKPVLYAGNKCDSPSRAHEAMSLYELGIDQLFPISAQHGLGVGDLEEALCEVLPDPAELEPGLDPSIPRLAIIGRPNAGKSSLTNRLLGEDRQIVDHRPGTTIDSIDALIEVDEQPFVLIDTAGIRRKRAVQKERGVEGLSVMKAIRAMERSNGVILMIDADEGVAEQDARLAGLAVDRGRALVIGLNKQDLIRNQETRRKAITRAKEILAFAPWAPIIPVSAKSGRGTHKLLRAVGAALVEHKKRISTSEINRFVEEVLEHHPPPTHKGKAIRLFYVTQAAVEPPTFVVVCNYPDAVHFSYQRYVINSIRQRFGFEGVPVRVFYRARRRRE
ncbi:MAG: ribosome biogenesis GTPase Der [Sandaracinaceae bacterium]